MTIQYTNDDNEPILAVSREVNNPSTDLPPHRYWVAPADMRGTIDMELLKGEVRKWADPSCRKGAWCPETMRYINRSKDPLPHRCWRPRQRSGLSPYDLKPFEVCMAWEKGLSQDFHNRVSKLGFQEFRVYKIPD